MQDIGSLLQNLSAAVIPGLFAITLHEVAHGWTARWRGDRTAELLGRLSLNPLRHIDPFGTILLPILTFVMAGFIIGAAKPVPVSSRNLRDPKRDMVLVAAAGPAANVVMGLAWALVLSLVVSLSGGLSSGAPGITDFFLKMAMLGVKINALLAIFNLVPIPPLDGGRVLRGLVPESLGRQLDSLERFGFILVLLLLPLGLFNLIMPLVQALIGTLLAIAGLGG